MESKEPQMTEAESLQLIASMINKAKNQYVENGFLYILWGWVILMCCLVQFTALYFFKNENAYYIWYITWLAIIFQIIYLRKKRRSRRTQTYTSEIGASVWVVFTICLFLLVMVLLHFDAYKAINPAILVMYGMATVLLGVIIKFKPLLIGGICCWLLSIMSMFVMYEFQLLLLAPAVIAAWLIPGYLLNQKFKKGISNGG